MSLAVFSVALSYAPAHLPAHSSPLGTASRAGLLRAQAPAASAPPAAAAAGAAEDHDILLRVARGESASRTPVWLMRQAGRYMSAFREYSDKYPFRMRSETPDIAVELSLQPWREFGVDGVIMFSDILTPLPALGVEFDVVKGKGPVIGVPLRSMEQVRALTPLEDPDAKLPFLREILGTLRSETEGKTSLLGFVGSPFTLVAYAIEGSANRHCIHTKTMMQESPETLHAALNHFADAVGQYACHQVECGAQLVQFFESWAHHLGPSQFETYAKPYANRAMQYVRDRHPDVPIVYYANGGSSYLPSQKDMACDMISLDWACDMAHAREVLGQERLVQGNIDPTVLMGSEAQIRAAVHECIRKGGGRGHLLNLGHGVLQTTPEESIRYFVEAAKELKLPLQ